VRVDNMNGEKVGHIKREQAAKLSSIMDNQPGIQVEGTIPRRGNHYNMPITIEFFSTNEGMADALAAMIQSSFQYDRTMQMHRGPNAVAPQSESVSKTLPKEDQPIVVEKKVIDWAKEQEELDNMWEGALRDQMMNVKEIEMPRQFSDSTKLLEHQIQGIQWLVHNETAKKTAPFFKKVKEGGKTKWLCDITQCSQEKEPPSVKGSILADEMGLGKTLQTIGVILYSKFSESPKSKNRKEPTLIVAPLSVVSNWVTQIGQHVKKGKLNVETYQGKSRAGVLDMIENKAVDVVLVSYHTLAREFTDTYETKSVVAGEPLKKKSRRSKCIFDIEFLRIVLDESHMIRSSKTSFFKACTHIHAERKLALTGTPFVNKPEDIQSLFSFLNLLPLADLGVFRRAISRPIKSGEDIGLSRLRASLSFVALRRSKGAAKIELVQKEIQLHAIEFPQDHFDKELYEALYQTFRLAIRAMMDGDSPFQKYSSILEVLLRMRQCCCSSTLVPKDRRDAALKAWRDHCSDGNQLLSAEEGQKLLEKLTTALGTASNADTEECAVCLESLQDDTAVVLRECSHVFCEPCISRVAHTTKKCPFCRNLFNPDSMVKKSAALAAASQKSDDGDHGKASDPEDLGSSSPKIEVLLRNIQEMARDEKAVVFSQFRSYLDIIAKVFDAKGIEYTRIDGRMNADQRLKAMKAFNGEGGPCLILCSLHAAGTGINLTRGNVVFMMDW